MKFDDYLRILAEKPSNIKNLVLRTLWDAGTDFPRDWVKSSTLLELTQQKYFDRRIRELRDELGCDIEFSHHLGEPCYRLNSTELSQYNPRLYLTASQKRNLFERNDHTCAICGKRLPPGIKGLQADHKIPLIRVGAHNESNWQPICNVCNVGKRRACADCQDDCQECPWAFPERLGTMTIIRLPQKIDDSIREQGYTDQKKKSDFISEVVEKYLAKGKR